MSVTATVSVFVGLIGLIIGFWLMSQGFISVGVAIGMGLISAALGAALGEL